MIGVAVDSTELQTVGEFFELFKSPWERGVAGRRYRAVLSTVGRPKDLEADVFLVYGPSESAVDDKARVGVDLAEGPLDAEWEATRFPLYGRVALFPTVGHATLHCDGRALDYRLGEWGQALWRVGYNLFDEVRHLLSSGQPAAQAATPTLDIHIALLRHLLRQSGVSFVEIPPRPAEHDFICCLTHDVDFFGIRRHALDSTLGGFVGRASFGTLAGLLAGRRSFGDAARNWTALLSLPLVLAGILPDPWQPIAQYEAADRGRPSTFFLVPFKDRPGIAPNGLVERRRAVRYQASEVRNELEAAAARGHELAVHGIDAWRDQDAGRAEMAQVAPLGGRATAGVRMHWLYFASDAPARLEGAGFEYDSTCGYNDAVGYRAGTSQVFRLLGSERLMELPIAIMDTALFYPGRLGLSRDEALERCRPIVAHARRAGGTVVVNWHDRSLAPERLWGRAYSELLDDLEHGAPWFATATEAVEWFRWRRSITFAGEPDGGVTIQAGPLRPGLPGASVAVQRPDSGVEEERVLQGGGVLRVNT
jgi:hypothetical protein